VVTRCGLCDGCRWGGVCSANRLYMGGNVLGDLHDGKGTTWVKEPDGQYWPNCCDAHRPESKRVKAAAADTPRKGKRPAAVKSDGLVAVPDEPIDPDIDDETAWRFLATWLKRLAKEKK